MFLTGASLLVDGGWLEGHGVLLEGGRIAGVLPEGEGGGAERVGLPAGSYLAPGLVDVQVNGGGGVLFNDVPDQAGARAIAAAHRALGTTSVMATLITDGPARMRRAAGVVAEPEAGVLGVHFEGPFIGVGRPGVHRVEFIRSPVEEDLVLLEGMARRGDGPVLLTVAPETVGDAAVRRLVAAGVVVAVGHSAAGYERVVEVLAAGARGFTHVFNAMGAMAGRDPGVAGAALTDGASWCGVIADGVHVHPAMLRLLLASRPGRVVLVSDAMPTVGTDVGEFVLQGRVVRRAGGCLRSEDGMLAGADICLMDAVRYCVRVLGVSLACALGMASAAPADFLRVGDRVGRIKAGLRGDLVLLDGGMGVLGVWKDGKASVLF